MSDGRQGTDGRQEAGRLYGYLLRPGQQEVVYNAGGRVAVSAIPGSGKTLTLALLAARLIVEGHVPDESEVLVVTVQNSAVDNISGTIRRILDSQRLPPLGFRVCTLHKLAADIVRARRDLAGVEDEFTIIDESETQRLLQSAVSVWISEHRALWESFLPQDEGGDVARLEEPWRQETQRIGREVTKLCKHLRLTPAAAQALPFGASEADDFARIGVELYERYGQYLRARSGLDFDDLIWQAIEALGQDPAFLANLRRRWPYILEDEAQDSSPLQEEILALLAGDEGNWVRVGDPNQAINSTFTAADPRFFREFLARDDVSRLVLQQSGRCGRPIIALANALVDWACTSHPEPAVRSMAFEPQHILPTDKGDDQPNPPDDECAVYFAPRPFADVAAQADQVARWAVAYVGRYPHRSVAVLCPAAWQGAPVVETIAALPTSVPCDDLLRTTPQTRNVARTLAAVCAFLSAPSSSRRLASLFNQLVEGDHLPADVGRQRQRAALIRSLPPHDLLFPKAGLDWDASLPESIELEADDRAALNRLRELAARWVRAYALPIDQLILTIAQDLFTGEADLAICHTIAHSLGVTAQLHPTWRLPDFVAELGQIARNRRSLGLSLVDAGYREQTGHVAVTTMHKAKGLEWDAVFLLCVDSLEYPHTLEDVFRDELFYMRGRAPAVQARKRVEQLAHHRPHDVDIVQEVDIVEEARLETISERLRLLYVGITRAKRHLAFCHCARNGRLPVTPSLALQPLQRALGSSATRSER
ncbi:MAG: ATP-dependent helicase [Anaerolineae bacterium]|nr:ATP-dependent helicase [Anaerolineae bacterium]